MPRQRRKAVLEDVARRARVSTATVSRALNETGPVAAKTRQCVLKAVARLGYTPNLNARALAAQDSGTLGVVVSNLDNPFFLDVYRGLEAEARRVGREVLLASTGYDPSRLVAAVNLMLGRRVSGIAAIVSEMAPAVQARLEQSGLPVVLYDVGRTAHNVKNLRVDYAVGMRDIVQLLHGLGHRRFAFVGHHAELAPLSVRQEVFVATMQQYGRDVQHRVITEADSLEGGYRAALRLLGADPPLTAIVCVNDVIAAGVLRALRERRLRVPEDVSVTGFDNVTLAQYVAPPLTTLDIPRAEIGRLAVDWLVHGAPRTGVGTPARDLVITPTLIVRESTGPAPITQQ